MRQIYVRPFPDAAVGAPRQVTIDGGLNPRWRADGTEILYEIAGDGGIGAATVTLEPTFSVGARRVVIPPTPGRYFSRSAHPQYDEDPNAGRVLRIVRDLALGDEDPRSRRLVYVQNWIEALRAQVGGN